jgi:hypothetical protein
MNSIKRVALDARVSTSNGYRIRRCSCESVGELIERRGWQVTEVYNDAGVSGTKAPRHRIKSIADG